MYYFYYFNGVKDILIGSLQSDFIVTVLDYMEKHDYDLTLFKIIPIVEYPLYFSQITPLDEIFNKLDSFKIEATIME